MAVGVIVAVANQLVVKITASLSLTVHWSLRPPVLSVVAGEIHSK